MPLLRGTTMQQLGAAAESRAVKWPFDRSGGSLFHFSRKHGAGERKVRTNRPRKRFADTTDDGPGVLELELIELVRTQAVLRKEQPLSVTEPAVEASAAAGALVTRRSFSLSLSSAAISTIRTPSRPSCRHRHSIALSLAHPRGVVNVVVWLWAFD